MGAVEKRRENQFFKETVNGMKNLGIYKKEFDALIRRYAEIRTQFKALNEQWTNEGCIITEEYTNKSGETHERKTALYSVIEKMRTELTEIENLLGLTPKGLQAIKKKGLEQPKKSALDKLLG